MKKDINKELMFCHHFFSARVTFFSNSLKQKKKAGKSEDLPA
jgi:hypothetical protein